MDNKYNIYIGARYVPKIIGEWNNSIEYEPLSIVTNQGASFTSKTYVPVGVDINNTDYWVNTGNYNAQIEYYRQETARVQTGLDDLKGDVTNIETNVSENTENITNLTQEISTVKTNVEKNTTDINNLTSRVSANEGNISDITNDVSSLQAKTTTVVNQTNARLLTVGNPGGRFTTINSAINEAKRLNVSKANPVTILVYAGSYNEQIVLNDVHGLHICGSGMYNTILHYNGSYPDCVVHVQGDVQFSNMTIKLDNQTTYAVHQDPSNTSVEGDVKFYNCYINGGTQAIGYGSGNLTGLFVDGCVLQSSGDCILYVHNSPYANKNGQRLFVNNCNFDLANDNQFVMRIDDSGNSNGGTVSKMYCTFSNNYCSSVNYGKIQFRKNTTTQENYSYVSQDETNIILTKSSANNAGIPGMCWNEGEVPFSGFFLFPANANTASEYQLTAIQKVNTTNYTGKIVNATLPGVGDITSNISMDGFYGYGVNFTTTLESVAGKTISISGYLYCK